MQAGGASLFNNFFKEISMRTGLRGTAMACGLALMLGIPGAAFADGGASVKAGQQQINGNAGTSANSGANSGTSAEISGQRGNGAATRGAPPGATKNKDVNNALQGKQSGAGNQAKTGAQGDTGGK